MTNAKLIKTVRERAQGLDFNIRWGVLEVCRRLEEMEERERGNELGKT